jgi:hypothetical protein
MRGILQAAKRYNHKFRPHFLWTFDPINRNPGVGDRLEGRRTEIKATLIYRPGPATFVRFNYYSQTRRSKAPALSWN